MTEVRRRGRPGQAEPVAQKGAQALERGIAILQYIEFGRICRPDKAF